jgi:xylulokinase
MIEPNNSPNGPFLLGIDIGGTGSKVGLFALDGQLTGFGYQEYQMISTFPGQAEHDADMWWKATVSSIKQAIQEADAQQVLGIGISNTNGLVPVDENARAIRPAIMLWDQRALGEVSQIRRVLDKNHVFSITGNPIAPGAYSLPTILWLKKNEANNFINTHKFLVPGGYIVAKLTDKLTIDYSRACTTLLFDIQRLEWHQPFLDMLDIPIEKLPKPFPSTSIVGEVSPWAAELTGLSRGTPVVAGCTDTTGAAIGSGIINPDELFIIMGTAARVCSILDKPIFDPRFMNFNYVLPGSWLAVGAINGVGSSLRWIRDNFGQMELSAAETSGENVYEILISQAAKAPTGSKGLIYLPYLSGERTPIWDPLARGVFFGITLAHNRNDILHSVLEGTAYAIRQATELLEVNTGSTIQTIRIGGAASTSEIWNQIIADTLGKQVICLAQDQTEVLGAAILAGVGIGAFSDFQAATVEIVKEDKAFDPDQKAHYIYNELFSIYTELYPSIAHHFQQLAGLNLQ